MIRYSDLIRIDQLYFDAGEYARKMNWSNYAFVLLNRFLDIFEVIEDPDNNNNLQDNSEL